MNTAEKRELITKYLSAYNSFDIEVMLSMLDPNIEFTNISDGIVNASAKGIESFRSLAEQGKSFFSSRRQTIEKFEEVGDVVSIDISFSAVLAIDFPNGLKAGEELNLKGSSEFTFSECKIKTIKDIS